MAITTYTELKSAVADFLNRTDLTAVVPTFISLAEVQMERALRVRQMVVRSTASIDTPYSAVPANFLATKTFVLTSTTPAKALEFATMEQIDDFKMSSNAPGTPSYFTVVGGQLRVYPEPDSIYTAELTYYGSLNKLSDSVATNWLLSSAPDAYLYGALLQSAPYLKDDERAGVWNSLFNSAIEAIKFADEAGSASGLVKVRSKSFGVR